MSNAKERVDACISYFLRSTNAGTAIARKLFLHDVPAAFAPYPNQGFELLNDISSTFAIPFASVKVVGSAQLGYSYVKHREFIPGKSDLDVAIINPVLFQEYSAVCYQVTARYTNNTAFSSLGGLSAAEVANSFKDYLAKGYFRPDLMPQCQYKTYWMHVFVRLAEKYRPYFDFRTINAGIYLSEEFFQCKQATLLDFLQAPS